MQKVNMMCAIGGTGYGITSYNIWKELRKKCDIALFPIRGVTVDTEQDRDFCLADIEKQNSFKSSDPFFKIWHQFDLAQRIGNGKYVALTFFETDKLKPIEICMINNTDTIMVASKWAKDILLQNGVSTNIDVCPLGVNLDIFNPSLYDVSQRDQSKYIFINIGKWELRKGHDILVEAFNAAFNKDDNVELWMVNHNPFLSTEQNMVWINLYKNSHLGEKIKIYDRLPKHQDLAALISLTDCGVFPARAEGWNNEIPEVMAMNKPVITTNYSAHTEYCNEENSYLINIDELTEASDDKFFDGYGRWADLGESQFDQLVNHMRFVYNNNIKTNPIGFKTAQNLTWKSTANIVYRSLF